MYLKILFIERNLMEEQGKISFSSAVLMSMSVMIGVGIYFLPQMMAENAGCFSFVGWIGSALLACPIVWNVAMAARMFPGSGGFYNYCSQGINESFGFIALWSYCMGFTMVAATQAMALKDVLCTRFGLIFFSEHPVVYNLIFVILLSFLNLLGIELISKIQDAGTILKLLPLFSIILIFAFYWNPNLVFKTSDLYNVGSTVPATMFGFFGFEACCSISHKIKGGSHRAAEAIMIAFLTTVALYVFFHLGIIHIMGCDNLVSQGVSAFPKFLGIKSTAVVSALCYGIGAAFVLTFLNTACGVLLSVITSLFGLAERNLTFFPSFFSKTSSNGSPFMLVFLIGFVDFLILTFIPYKDVLVALSVNLVVIAYVLTQFAVLFRNIKLKASAGTMIITTLGVASSFAFLYFAISGLGNNCCERAMYFGLVIALLAFGFVMFKFQKSRQAY
jgi:amino acid transporter